MCPVIFTAIDRFVGCGVNADWIAPPPNSLDIQLALMSKPPLKESMRMADIHACLLRGDPETTKLMCTIMTNPKRNMTWVFGLNGGYDGCMRLTNVGAPGGEFASRPPPTSASGVSILDDWSDVPGTWDFGPLPEYSRECEALLNAPGAHSDLSLKFPGPDSS
jgi:hypothetical protein